MCAKIPARKEYPSRLSPRSSDGSEKTFFPSFIKNIFTCIPVTVDTCFRLRHKGGVKAVAFCYSSHSHLEGHHFIGCLRRVGELKIYFMLPGRYLMVEDSISYPISSRSAPYHVWHSHPDPRDSDPCIPLFHVLWWWACHCRLCGKGRTHIPGSP
mgnify:CR=1 FL=1